MPESNNETPPGWYPDPANPNQLRYWDGSTWTDATSESLVTPYVAEDPGEKTVGPGFLVPIGQWLGETLRVVKKNWLTFLGLSVGLPLAINVAFFVAVIVLAAGLANTSGITKPSNDGFFDPLAIGALLVVYAALWLALLVPTLAIVDHAYARHANEVRSAGASIRWALRRLFPFVGWMLLIGLAAGGITLALSFGIGLGGWIHEAIGGGLTILAVFVGGPAAVYVSIRLAFVGHSVILNPGENPVTVSGRLAEGRMWALLGRLILLAGMWFMATIVLMVLLAAAPRIGQVIFFVLWGVPSFFLVVAHTGLYHQIKGPSRSER